MSDDRSKDPVDLEGMGRRGYNDDERSSGISDDAHQQGPGHVGGGYAGQQFDTGDRSGTYGEQARGGPARFAQHGSAEQAHGSDQITGSMGGSYHGGPMGAGQASPEGSDHPQSWGEAQDALPNKTASNAMVGGGQTPAPSIRDDANERTAPGISTDKKGDDTKLG